MSMLRVDCVTPDNPDGDRWIEGVGGDGFYHPAELAIRNIQEGIHTYYTIADGKIALIDVRKDPATGKLFLQAIAKGYAGGDLSDLPGCRGAR